MIILQISNSYLSLDDFYELVDPINDVELLKKNDLEKYLPTVKHKSLDPNLMAALISGGISGGFTVLSVLLQAFLNREEKKRAEKDKLGLNGVPTLVINYTELNTEQTVHLKVQSDENSEEIINKLQNLAGFVEKSNDARVDLTFWD